MLESFANRIRASAPQRHLLFVATSLVAIVFIGYHFGTFDQAIHIPFLKKYAEPALFPGDQFFDLRFVHYSYFWFLFQPFHRLGVLEPVMFAAHVLATYLTFWALWTLSETLFDDSLAALLTVAATVLPHVGFAGFPLFEFSLLNRTFVLPFLLWAIILFLRRRYWLAFWLLGTVYNLHVISAQFVLAMFLFDGVMEFRRIGWRSLVGGMGLFLLAALPVLVWKLGGSPVDLTPRPEWFDIISRGTLFNLFYLIAPYPHIVLASLAGLSTLALFVIGRRGAAPPPDKDRTVLYFIAAVLIILTVQIVTAQWLPITIIVQSQIIRAGLFALIFGYVYFARYLARLYRNGAERRGDFAALAAAVAVATIPIVPVLVWALQRFVSSARWRQLAAWGTLTLAFAGTLAMAFDYRLWYPGIHIYAHRTPWYDAQVWARDNTPRDAVFITPPHIWWLYKSEWRVFSERSTVSTHSELLEAAFEPEYIEYWKPRFEAIAPGALERFEGDFFANQAVVARAFYDLSADELLDVARAYGASYLVVEKPHTRVLPLAYENEGFIVYDLRAAAATR